MEKQIPRAPTPRAMESKPTSKETEVEKKRGNEMVVFGPPRVIEKEVNVVQERRKSTEGGKITTQCSSS
jgi:hypothetical protein